MSTELAPLKELAGFTGACLVDSETGLLLTQEEGADGFNLEAAAAANTEVVRSKYAAMKQLGVDDTIEDILITLGKQTHLIRPLASNPAVFVYLALDKNKSNLGMARIKLKSIEGSLKI